MDSTSGSSGSGVGERLAYLQVELSRVLFLPFPAIEPSSSAKISYSDSKSEPYEVLARLIKAGEDHSSPIFVPIIGRDTAGVLVCRSGCSGSGVGIRAGAATGSSGGGWSRSIVLISSESSCLNCRDLLLAVDHHSSVRPNLQQ